MVQTLKEVLEPNDNKNVGESRSLESNQPK